MGVPAVKTKLLAYASGAAFGGVAGAFLALPIAAIAAAVLGYMRERRETRQSAVLAP
jgi:ABC-type branched-subunit amino acid transport system permease subunit